MPTYSDFSRFYDELTDNVNYSERADYIDGLIRKNCNSCDIVVDLACGTGSLTVKLAEKGYDMIGIDCSADMLTEAQNKIYETGQSILFLCQKMQELDLYGTVDAVVCTLDSINHLTSEKDVLKTFEKVSLFMNKGGVFIFDVNTPYKHNKVLGNSTFVYETEDVFCVWQNELVDTDTVEITLNFFENQGDVYERYEESFCEKAYSTELLVSMLEKSGFDEIKIYDEMTENEPKENSERLFFVAKKV